MYNTFKDFENLVPNSRTNRITHIQGISDIDLNVFGNAVSKAEIDLTNERDKAQSEFTKLNSRLSNYGEDNNGVPTAEDLEIFDELEDYFIDQHLYSDYLTALSEMKIVYIFKTLEINMKTLIKTAYPNVITKGFYQWENMVSFFNSMSIKISDISGYQETIELRKVNNCIKHTDLISDDVKKIREFASLKYFDSSSINTFHDRIKDQIKVFFIELSNLVIRDLFDFDHVRIDKLCDDYSNRMDKNALKVFVESLQNRIK